MSGEGLAYYQSGFTDAATFINGARQQRKRLPDASSVSQAEAQRNERRTRSFGDANSLYNGGMQTATANTLAQEDSSLQEPHQPQHTDPAAAEIPRLGRITSLPNLPSSYQRQSSFGRDRRTVTASLSAEPVLETQAHLRWQGRAQAAADMPSGSLVGDAVSQAMTTVCFDPLELPRACMLLLSVSCSAFAMAHSIVVLAGAYHVFSLDLVYASR